MLLEYPVINEDTYQDHLGDATQGRNVGCLPRTLAPGSVAGAVTANYDLIPRSEWADRITDQKNNGERMLDLLDYFNVPCMHQESTLWCHSNSPTLAVMAVRAVQGQDPKLLSPASIAGPITGYQNKGMPIHAALNQITTGGVATQDFVPPNSMNPREWQAGWQADAAKNVVTEWWDCDPRDGKMFDRAATLLFQRVPVCVAYYWWGHAVTLIDVVIVNLHPLTFGFLFRNSWGTTYGKNGYAILQEGKGTPNEAYAPRSVSLSV